MKFNIRQFLALFLMIAVFGSMLSTVVCAEPEEPAIFNQYYRGERTRQKIWDINSEGEREYPRHRIPGIVVTKKDTVIIYCEARTGDTTHSLQNANDWCLMDIYLQRSTDGGKTFGKPIYIARGNENTACVNNPVIMVGNDNTLHILYCKNYSQKGGGLWYRKSTDDGMTWTPEREVTQYADNVPHTNFAFGPTHGICTREGVLMAPVWLSPIEGGTSHVYVFYSNDDGKTWAMSERASQNSNETDIVQLSNGDILLNSRHTPCRLVTTSKNGIKGWISTAVDPQLPDPNCCAGMVTVDLPGLPYTHLFTNCATSGTERDNLTVKCSFDDCITWEKPVLLNKYQGGYSDIAVDSQGKVYVLYETSYGRTVNLETFSFVDAFLKDEPLRVSQRSEFTFDSEQSLSLIPPKSCQNVEPSFFENSIRLTATAERKYSFALDFSSLTQNLNISDKQAIGLKIRVNSKSKSNFQLGFFTQAPRFQLGASEKYHSVNVPADGEWHTATVDLSLKNAEGILKRLKFDLFADTFCAAVGDTVDIAFLNFYDSEEEAKEALNLNPSDSNPDSTEAEKNEPTEKKGCGSVILSEQTSMLLGFAAVPIFFCKKRKRNR